MVDVIVGGDGNPRCRWGGQPDLYRRYHDEEWGRPVTEDHLLFEKLSLEGFQAGLSWLTILRKRPAFRAAFANFDLEVVAAYTDGDVKRLLDDAGIVRHEGKIRSTINNAARAVELRQEHGSLAAAFWPLAEPATEPPEEIPPSTDTSKALARRLKDLGWTFVGPTTVYAFMQAMGIVNDHAGGCWVR
ncbi:MAG: DNA-3-methyladenine glycosylase I, partial [Acidimicrobiia bacterium]